MEEQSKIDVLMTGSDPRENGGIAAIVTILLEDGLFKRYQVRYIVSHATGSYGSKANKAVRALWQMLWICWLRRPAIVHAHCAADASFFRKSLMLSVARRFGCATVLHLHGSRFRQYAQEEAGWLRRCFIRRTLRRSSVVIALSDSWAHFVQELTLHANVRVIANAVYVPSLPVQPAPKPYHILFLGQLGQRKGIYELIEAVARLRCDFPQVRLVIGGDGELHRVRELIASHGLEGNVELLGWVAGVEKERQLRRAAMFCLPSHNEGLPMAMLEAMAASLPVVVTPVGGIAEVIDDGINGLMVPPGDIVALESALRRLLGDAGLCRRMGAQAYQTVRAGFYVAGMVEHLSALYDELCPALQAAEASSRCAPAGWAPPR